MSPDTPGRPAAAPSGSSIVALLMAAMLAGENMGKYGLDYWFMPKICVNMDWIRGVCAKNMGKYGLD